MANANIQFFGNIGHMQGTAASHLRSAAEMLETIRTVGEINGFGEVETAESVAEQVELVRSRAAQMIENVAKVLRGTPIEADGIDEIIGYTKVAPGLYLKTPKYEVVLTQDVYLGDNGDYCASGYLTTEKQDNETGPTVRVTWSAFDGAEEMDDESSRCDWANPVSIEHFRIGDITHNAAVRN